MNIGAFILLGPLRSGRVAGETVSGVLTTGDAMYYEVQGPGDLHLAVRDTAWGNGERDVVTCARFDSPQIYDTLVERMRLSVLDRDGIYVELRQARLRANGHAGLFDASIAAISRGADLDVPVTLRQFGATAIGARYEILGDTGRVQYRIGARLANPARSTPVIAYLLTRIAPVANGITA